MTMRQDEHAFRAELAALLPRLRRFGLVLTGNSDQGDDLVQSACLRALANMRQWQPGTRMDSWLFRIMNNLWIDQLRANRVRGVNIDPEMVQDEFSQDGIADVENHLLLQTVRENVTNLPEDQRAVLLLVAIEGNSYKEASEILNIPIGTVMSRLSRARRQLADALKGKVGTIPEAKSIDTGCEIG